MSCFHKPPSRLFQWVIPILFLSACTSPLPSPPTSLPSPFPLFTSSPFPLFTPSPASPNPPLPASLHSPDPSILLRALNYGIGLEQDAWEQFDYGNFTGDFLTSPEARALFDFVQADYERSYANGIPRAGEVLTNGLLDLNIWFPPRAVWTLTQAGVVELLRETGHTLKQGEPLTLADFTLTPSLIELDGDPTPEWLVEVDSQAYNLRGWLPIDEQDGQYTLIPNDLRHENQARAQAVATQITPDLNGDALADFVVHFDGQPLGTQFGYSTVYGWAEDGFYWLDTIQIKPGEIIEVNDFDGDSQNEIHLAIPRSLNFECVWTQHNLYRWQGEENLYTFLNETPPETPICDAARALYPLPNLTPNERAILLEKALANLSPETSPSDDYLALLRIHLAMAYAAQGFEQQALSLVTGLPEWAGRVWKAADENSPAFCNALYAETGRGALDTTGLARYLSPVAMLQAYGQITIDPGALACPLWDWAQYRLQTLTPPITHLPGEYWPELGAALFDPTPYQLDDDPEEEWIGWLDWKIPQFLLLDPMGETWRLVRLDWKPNPLAQFQSNVTDFDEDGILDILLLATFDASVPVSAYPKCWAQSASQVSDLTRISWSEGEIVMGGKTTLCGEPPALDSLSAAQLQEWFTEVAPSPPTLETDSKGFYRLLEEQEALILSEAGALEARMALKDLLPTVPPDHPASGTVIPRILFSIALSYEIGGNTDAALAAYQDLMAQWPDTPWAWLAEARMNE